MRFLTLAQKKSRLALASSLLVLALASSASAYFYVYPPYTPPSGFTYSTLSAEWWKWVLTIPADKNPLLDTTGANAAVNQTNGAGPFKLFFFLVGSLDSTPVTRNVTVPSSKTLVFPVLNALYGAFASDPAAQRTESYVRSQVTYVEDATDLSVVIDGTPVSNVQQWLEKSNIFSVTLPANNIYGVDAGTVLSPSADEGYYLALTQWIVGSKHTIHWKATLNKGTPDQFTQDITYNITVK
jgi:hypothetical protein